MSNTLTRLLFWSAVALIVGPGCIDLRALDLAGFRTCVSASGSGDTCTLDPKFDGLEIVSWDITTPIAVQRPVTVQGNPAYPGQVKIKRMGYIQNMMYVAGYVAGATVHNLFFDGNGANYPGASSADLLFQDGSWNNYVTHSKFHNAPGFAIHLKYYTYIQYCDFVNPKYVAIHTMNPAGTNRDIGIYNSFFYGSGTNAVYFTGGTFNSIIHDSDFLQNHSTCLWNSSGGQILLDASTSEITIQNSNVDGNYTYCSSYPESSAGLEGYGSLHKIIGNLFKRHRWFGMYFTAAGSISIENNEIHANWSNGLNISGTAGGLPCCDSPTYEITSNTFQDNSGFGIYASRDGCAAGPSSATITLSGNTFINNGGTTSLDN